MFLQINWIDLFIQMFEGCYNGLGYAFEHYFIDIINISFPDRWFLIDIDFGMHLSDQLMNLTSLVFYDLLFLRENTLLLSIVIFDSHGSILSFQDFHVNIIQAYFYFCNSFFHNLNNFEGTVHLLFCLFNEICYIFRLPF